MLKTSISNALWGLITIVFGLLIAILAISVKSAAIMLLAAFFAGTSLLLFALSVIELANHEKIVGKYFLKKYSRERRLATISKAVWLCRIDDYPEWWKSQKDQNLESDHVSFGVLVAILGGVIEKDDVIKYGNHLESCQICQHYYKSWIPLISRKIKKREKTIKQSGPF